MGRSGHGVRAIKLAEGDEVVGVCICREGGTVLTVTENGKGRRSDIDTYRITARGGKGIRNYDVTKDKVAAVKIVDDVDDVLLSSRRASSSAARQRDPAAEPLRFRRPGDASGRER